MSGLAIIGTVARSTNPASIFDLAFAVASPYLAIVGLLSVLLLALLRRTLLTLLALAAALTATYPQVDWYWIPEPVEIESSGELRVLSLNLRRGEADPSFLVELAKRSTDVITFSELTQESVAALGRAGIDKWFPYSAIDPRPRAAGIGLWSRFPLNSVEPVRDTNIALVSTRIRVPNIREEVLVASVHIVSPGSANLGAFRQWKDGISELRANLKDFTARYGETPIIVAGDFNSTPDLRPFRELMETGFQDAVDRTGCGWSPTFPSHPWLPPLITIDHILTRNSTVSSARSISVPRSDHRAIFATVQLRD